MVGNVNNRVEINNKNIGGCLFVCFWGQNIDVLLVIDSLGQG